MSDIDKIRQLAPLMDEAEKRILEIFNLVNDLGKYEINGGNRNDLADFTRVKELMLALHVSTKSMNNTFRDNGAVKF